MKLNKKHLEFINETIKHIIDWCDYFEGMEDELLIPVDKFNEILENNGEGELLEFSFPGPDDYFSYELIEFLEIAEEIKTIEIVDNSLVRTKHLRYYIVKANDTDDNYIISDHIDIKPLNIDGAEINLVDESFFIGLAATKLEEYDSDYWGTSHQYLAVEIKYENKKSILDVKNEIDLINSYLFEIADNTGIAITRSEIRNPIYDFEERKEEAGEEIQFLRDLESYNEGMRFFVSAVQIKEPDLKFLNFYKVLEHFAPIAVNIEANELMRKKLDAPKRAFEDGDFIRSIFELANSTRDKFNDEDLIKAAFNTCFDFVGLYKFLPESIQKKIKKHIGNQELNYSTDKQKITTSCNIAAKIIYKTRNKVVHAKSNFNLTGEEISPNEMDKLNEFMKAASSQSIRWYNRQPQHMKLNIIKQLLPTKNILHAAISCKYES